jgi:hypothetical protein
LRGLVHPALWRQLAAQTPNVPPHVRALSPRVSGFRLLPVAAGAARVDALVDDGERRYAIRFVVARASGRWQVMSIGGS